MVSLMLFKCISLKRGGAEDRHWCRAMWSSPQYVALLHALSVCAWPVRVLPVGCNLMGAPICSSSKPKSLPGHGTGPGWWHWSGGEHVAGIREMKLQRRDEKWRNNVFYVHMCMFNTICLSGIWQTACCLHCLFFSIDLKVWTRHYKIQWQNNFPVIRWWHFPG